ncbi:MAG: peptidyl-prolyl cis-trans isomerase [Sedimentisphaerales bacterium]|nr:peptidyl-prolyl cis-trans isomerase [Sedimentisphaerales bacterium]
MKNSIIKIIAVLSIACGIAQGQVVSGPAVAADPAVSGSDNGGELVLNGFVLSINGDAISSYDIIEKTRSRLEAIGTDNYRKFYTQAYTVIRETVMADIYDLLMYQYSMHDMERNEFDDQIIERAKLKRKKEIIRDHGGNEPITHEELKKAGTSMDAELDKYIRRMIISGYKEVFFSADQSVSRLEVMDYYESNKDKYTNKARMQFRLIELEGGAREQAQSLLARLQSGEDFGKLAEEYSSDWRAGQGGLWNELDPQSIKKLYVPVVEELLKLSPGALTPIVESEGKLYIARLESYSPSSVKQLSEVQEEIRRDILEMRWVEYTEQLSAKLLERAVIGDIDHFIAGTIYTAWKKMGGREELEIIDSEGN